MRVAQLIMLISICSGSEEGSGVPTLSPSFRPTAEAARHRLVGSIPPTLSPTFSPQEEAGRRRLWESARRWNSKDRDSSELSPLELEQRDCDIGLEMPYRYLADWCQSLKEEEACNRSYELMGSDKDRKKSGLAYAMACKWYSGPDPTANVDPTEAWVGRSVCAADVSCIVVKDWVSVPGNYTSGKNGNKANGNSGSDSPPELTPTDLLKPTARPTSLPSRMPTVVPTTATPTAGPSATPTRTPSRAPTAAPTRSPTRSPTRQPTSTPSGQPSPAPTSRPVSAAPSPPPASSAGFSPRCGKLKVVNRKVSRATKFDAKDAEDCYSKCSEVCDGCERNDSWSFKAGSKSPCTCFGLESEFKFKESAEFFGATDVGTRPQCGSLKVGKKGISLFIGKLSSPAVCQWRCGGHGNGNEGNDTFEQFQFKYAKDGKTGDCTCASGKAKKKHTQTFGFTSQV